MKASDDDYLWDPAAPPERTIAELERLLAPASAQALKLADRQLPLAASRAQRPYRSFVAAAAAFALIAIGTGWFFHRLSWPTGASWPVVVTAGGSSREASLEVGATISTAVDETAKLSAARIGTITVAERSSATLVETRSNRHRFELEYGRLHAKIWAPPGYFGVKNQDAVAVDLGCEFDLEAAANGAGRLSVINGWVIYNRRGTETLVPQGHVLDFDDQHVGIPVRVDSNQRFAAQVNAIDALLTAASPSNDQQLISLSDAIAATATDEDYLTLLILVSRHRTLMQTPIHTRLTAVLGDPGEVDSINEWWRRVPKPPKQWWWNWRDAF